MMVNTVLVHLTILVAAIVTVDGQSVSVSSPYGIGFYHGDPALAASTCQNEFDQVSSYVYPTYAFEVRQDSCLTLAMMHQLESLATSTSGTGGSVRRQLLRSSVSKDDANDNEGQYERKLQSWCYSLCDERPIQWLILHGCKDECGLRRKLDETDAGLEEAEDKDNAATDRSLFDSLSSMGGDITAISEGPGDTTVSQFYVLVESIIPASNPCQFLLQNMTYRVYPLVINL
jgi:hypothetical protein